MKPKEKKKSKINVKYAEEKKLRKSMKQKFIL